MIYARKIPLGLIFWGFFFFLSCICTSSSFAESYTDDVNARFNGIPTMEYNGDTYRLNRRLTTLLFIGVDKTAMQQADSGYRNGGQADFLALAVVDDLNKCISVLQINRDTMVDLKVLNFRGEETGTRRGQICLSYAFGDGAEESCELTTDAVSRYLNDTPIDYYIAMNLDGISTLNDALGGVEVTLEDDFSSFDSSMTPGTTLTLQGEQAEYYVRMRYSVGDETNASRLQRQRNYMSAASQILMERLREDSGYSKVLYAQLEDYLISDISRGALYNIADKASRYEIRPIVSIEGSNQLGESGFMEFYPEEASLQKAIVDILYQKVD